MTIEDIIEAQGWDDESVKELLFRYIEKQDSLLALRDFLEQAAAEENAG